MIRPGVSLMSLVVLMTGFSSAADSQDDSAAAGRRVRVLYPPHSARPLSGVLVGTTADSLYLVPDGGATPEPIALADIRRLQQSRGERSNLWRGAGYGAIAGAGAGLALGLAEPVLEEGAEESAIIPVATAAGGALIGGIVGGLIGALSHSERWEPMTWVDPLARNRDQSPDRSGGVIGIGVLLSVGSSAR